MSRIKFDELYMQVFVEYDEEENSRTNPKTETLTNAYKLPKGLFKKVEVYLKDCYYFNKKDNIE